MYLKCIPLDLVLDAVFVEMSVSHMFKFHLSFITLVARDPDNVLLSYFECC